MSLIKKSDVTNRLSPRHRNEVYLVKPASQPDATGFSNTEPGARKVKLPDFAKDFQGEHSFSGTGLAQIDPLTVSIGPQAPPAASKSVQA